MSSLSKNSSIQFTIDADMVSASDFKNSIDDLYDILLNMSGNVYGDAKAVTWLVSVESGSNRVVWYPEASDKNANPAMVIGAINDGIKSLSETDKRPKYFNDNSLFRLRTITRRFSGKNGKSMASIGTNGKSLPLIHNIQQNINSILSGRHQDYGSVEGVLESISSKRGLYFAVYDKILKRSIRCKFNEMLIDKAKEAFMKKVLVSGSITYDKDGYPQAVKVEEMDIFPPKESLPTYNDILGILRG